jgi:hypothetical protein
MSRTIIKMVNYVIIRGQLVKIPVRCNGYKIKQTSVYNSQNNLLPVVW